MKSTFCIFLISLAASGGSSIVARAESPPKETVLEVVRNFTRVKILKSNNVGLRPGSLYDNITIFESLLDFPHPGFNYEFIDSGLGAAEPLYPMYQKGYQWSWLQLIPAFFSDQSRHIDHFTSLVTPEGCKVEGLYSLRHISEYPDTMFAQERKEGFEQIVIRLEHYSRLFPGAECGRHMAEDEDPMFHPMKFVIKHHNAMSFDEYPQETLKRFEWKLSAIHHWTEERNINKWPRFDLDKLNHNSLWYYPDGHTEDYGINLPRPQPDLATLNVPKHLFVPATSALQAEFPLTRALAAPEFNQIMAYLNGHPTPEFDPAKEPGGDTLRLSDVTENNTYTSGLYLERIKNAAADVSDARNYALVGMTVKPYEEQDDLLWQGTQVIPQIRFVYQLMDPRTPNRPFEQLYYHLKYDVVDRHADQASRDAQHRHFLQKTDELARAKDSNDPAYPLLVSAYIREFTARPVESISFSSSLTGIWVFGSIARSYNPARELQAVRVVRDGVDVGYYSSTHDNDLFRDAINGAEGAQKALLEKHM